MVKTVSIFTTTRADFGIWAPLLKEIENRNSIKYKLFVGGTHLKKSEGYTIEEIRGQNISIEDTFDFLSKSSDPEILVKGLSKEQKQLAVFFKNKKIDAVLVLGDRFEYIPVVLAAIIFNKPIFHIHGGESTEGLIDEQIRHMITKASHLHFAACEDYADNIREMGEENWRVFNTGALGVDAVKKRKTIAREELFGRLGLDTALPTALLTYHPVTLEQSLLPAQQMENLFEALDGFDLQVMITASNVDVGREEIMDKIKKELKTQENYHFVESLGSEKYYSLVAGSEFVIGNSSSGLLEVPYFHIPTVNIGDRQKGRIRHKSVIDTGYKTAEIKRGIENALEPEFQETIKNMELKFGDGHAAEKMADVIEKIEINQKLLRKKLDFAGSADRG